MEARTVGAVEMLRLKRQNLLLQAQSLERDIIVLNYKSLMDQANAIQQEIGKAEEEVRQNEMLQKANGIEPIDTVDDGDIPTIHDPSPAVADS